MFVASQLRIPRVVGMLGSGLLLANVPGGVVAAFPDKWGVQLRAAALATIFLRCGLELEFKVSTTSMLSLAAGAWPSCYVITACSLRIAGIWTPLPCSLMLMRHCAPSCGLQGAPDNPAVPATCRPCHCTSGPPCAWLLFQA
jgi:hypothetical protein